MNFPVDGFANQHLTFPEVSCFDYQHVDFQATYYCHEGSTWCIGDESSQVLMRGSTLYMNTCGIGSTYGWFPSLFICFFYLYFCYIIITIIIIIYLFIFNHSVLCYNVLTL